MMKVRRWATIEPVIDWPGGAARSRTTAAWRATEADTWALLGAEIEKLHGRNVRIGLAIRPEQLTLDGSRLRAGESPWHPGVIVKFDTKDGELRYACDAYIRHVDNLRSIAKTLEALRAVSRWGTLSGEQYRGNLAIESGIAMPANPFNDAAGARRFLIDLLGWEPEGAWRTYTMSEVRVMLRQAQRATHPDRGGDAEDFRLVSLAETYLRETP